MTFPTIQTTSVGGNGTATTTPTITLPTGIVNGDKVIILLAVDQTGGVSAAPITWPAGWSKPTNDYGNSTAAGLFVGYRDCDGTEGASISPTLSASGNYSYACYRISGSLSGAPEVAVHAVDSVGTINPNPPSLTPSGGAKDYLWLAVSGWDSGTTDFSTDPTNYTTSALKFDESDLAGTAVAGIAVGTRQLNAASEDPGTFALSISDQWESTTIAVSPSGVAAASKKIMRETFGAILTESNIFLLT